MKTKCLALLGAVIVCACQSPAADEKPQGPTLAERTKIMYDDFAAGNVDAVVARWDPGIVWNEAENFIYADGNPYTGAEAVLEGVFGRIGAEWDNFRLEEATFQNLDSTGVLVTGRYRGTFKANGEAMDAQFAHVWKFRDTLAVSFQQYTDTKQAFDVAATETEDAGSSEE